MSKDNPIVSIIIPTYNRAHLVGRAIQSALNQTYQDFEIIIVDDNSTDNIQKVVNEFQKKDKRIRYIKMNVNKGSAAARNIGIKSAKGDYIAFLDSDDEWLPTKLEKQIELFATSNKKNLGLVSCNAFTVNQEKANHMLKKYITPQYINVFQKLLEGNFIYSSSSVVTKRSVIQDIGLFDEKLRRAQDYEMWLRIAQKYSFDCVSECLFRYYVHDSSITRTARYIDKIRILQYILQKHIEYYKMYPKVYSIKIRNLGVLYILSGQILRGKRYFLKSIKINPLNIKSYIYFFIYGSKLYKMLSYVKSRIKSKF